MKKDNKGFSLIELIVVIAIMAILVGVLAPQFMKYVESSKQSTDIQNASAIRSAVEVGVTDGSITSNVTVKVAANKIEVENADSALDSVGLSNSVDCKSQGWTAQTVAVYNVSTFKWTVTDNTNSKAPGKNLGTAFK